MGNIALIRKGVLLMREASKTTQASTTEDLADAVEKSLSGK